MLLARIHWNVAIQPVSPGRRPPVSVEATEDGLERGPPRTKGPSSHVGTLCLDATARLEPQQADLVVVPGAAGRLPDEDEATDDSIPVVLSRVLDTGLPALLKEALDRPGLTVATVCGGSMMLAMAGLIEGRPATTHHLGLDLMDATGTTAIDARVVDDGDLVTGAGVTSGLDLGLYLLERELGPRVALAVEKLFAHERRGTVWRATGTEPTVRV
jgi:transcriptional regulator GlxA family with amidase domain